jgi:TorA maturation chaperone TorD
MNPELLRALGVLAEDAGPAQARIALALGIEEPIDAAAFTELFLFKMYPYASVYLGAEGMLGGEARDRVAGFWRALALDPPAESDHLTALLALYARVVETANAESDTARRLLLERAANALFWEHLASWLPIYLHRVRDVGTPAYRHWAELLEAALLEEAAAVGPAVLSRHLAEAPLLSDPSEISDEAFLTELLAPARCGFIIVRDDLARAAEETGAGLRQGERRYVLSAMLSHDRRAVLRRLRQMAERAAAAHAAISNRWGDVRTFWYQRAARSAQLLAA